MLGEKPIAKVEELQVETVDEEGGDGGEEEGNEVLEDESLEEEQMRVLRWRSWLLSKIEHLVSRLEEMHGEEAFALQWLNTDDIEEALNAKFIEDNLTNKYVERAEKKKGKAVVAVEEEPRGDTAAVHKEEKFEEDTTEALKRSLVETHRSQGESSKDLANDVVEEEGNAELVDFEPSPLRPTKDDTSDKDIACGLGPEVATAETKSNSEEEDEEDENEIDVVTTGEGGNKEATSSCVEAEVVATKGGEREAPLAHWLIKWGMGKKGKPHMIPWLRNATSQRGMCREAPLALRK